MLDHSHFDGWMRSALGAFSRTLGVGPQGPDSTFVRHVPAILAECPRCQAAAGAVSLVTDRTVYFACAACRHRWSATPSTWSPDRSV